VRNRLDTTAVGRRLHQTISLLRHEGAAGVAARGLRRLADRVAPPSHMLNVFGDDVLEAAEVLADAPGTAGGGRSSPFPGPLSVLPGEPLSIAWVMSPPAEGSGGHTTIFRMIGALEQAGHCCTVYLYDRWGGTLAHHRDVLRRWWPWVHAEVRDISEKIDDAHAIVATAWPTAYAVAASPAKGARFYFVQDIEPWFHPAGGESLLAEATYRFGLHGITAGRWLANRLRSEYAMPADHFDFGCDLDTYRLAGPAGCAAGRTGVCFFARPKTPRRAFDLGVLALELFSARRPDVDVHLFGERVGRLGFPGVDHGVMNPSQLAALYSRCHAGLVLSATNVSLVPHEMLAAGCIPVVNDAEHNRVVLDNDHIEYAPATPHDLAAALERLVARSPAEAADAAARAAASVRGRSWDDAGVVVERVIRRVVGERCGSGVLSGRPASGRRPDHRGAEPST
jgi:WsaF, C-terminal domain